MVPTHPRISTKEDESLREQAALAKPAVTDTVRCRLSVHHGIASSPDQLARITQLSQAAWCTPLDGTTASLQGGSHDITVTADGPSAEDFIDQLHDLANELNPGPWTVRREHRL